MKSRITLNPCTRCVETRVLTPDPLALPVARTRKSTHHNALFLSFLMHTRACVDKGHVGSSPIQECWMHFYCIKSDTDDLFDDC